MTSKINEASISVVIDCRLTHQRKIKYAEAGIRQLDKALIFNARDTFARHCVTTTAGIIGITQIGQNIAEILKNKAANL